MTAILVAAAGGHLAQLHRLAPRLDVIGEKRLWVTFDGPQSRSLLDGEPTVFVPYVGPRDLRAAALNARIAARMLRELDIDLVVSTGSAVAMSFLPLARMFRVPSVYIESAARFEGPSLTGRLIERVPGVVRLTQHDEWASKRWSYIGSVFDEFVPARVQPAKPDRLK